MKGILLIQHDIEAIKLIEDKSLQTKTVNQADYDALEKFTHAQKDSYKSHENKEVAEIIKIKIAKIQN